MTKPIINTNPFRSLPVEEAEKNPQPSRKRRILPIHETPSVLNPNTVRKVDKEISGLKVQHRLVTEYVKIMLEKFMETPLHRGHTDLQGAKAKEGWQAAHAALTPATLDNYTEQMVDRVAKNGFSPHKSEPFFRKRLGMTSPEKKSMTDVRQFAQDRLPKGGDKSSLADTRFHWNSNATFENPDESNQFDSRLEKTLKPFLARLQERRMKGELSPSQSMEELTAFLIKYCQKSIENITQRLHTISAFGAVFERMRAFELSGAPIHQSYLDDVKQYLTLHTQLTDDKEGCLTCGAFKTIRKDHSFLKKLLIAPSPQHFFKENNSHLFEEMHFDTALFTEKYTLYLQEAQAQLASVTEFAEPCIIPNLLKTVFGVMDGGVRRAPTDDELSNQLNAMFQVATPVRAKRKKENVADSDPNVRKALKFEAD